MDSISSGDISTGLESINIPPFGRVEKISDSEESFFNFQASVCSLPPFPTMRIFILIFQVLFDYARPRILKPVSLMFKAESRQ